MSSSNYVLSWLAWTKAQTFRPKHQFSDLNPYFPRQELQQPVDRALWVMAHVCLCKGAKADLMHCVNGSYIIDIPLKDTYE